MFALLLTEYDPNPLLLLTKRRRTMSTSESTSSEPKKSSSEVNKECKGKRGPGRPPKPERLMSNESIGDEDVFLNDSQKQDNDKKKKTESMNNTEENNSSDEKGREVLILSYLTCVQKLCSTSR